jgi:predicted ribosome quality control (RQC) complex YloA/Tae2 family protein
MVGVDKTFENNSIKIGKNARDNDTIIKESKETDIWFHLASFPSCHVIIECSTEYPINTKMIIYCAALVKQNGKYKNIHKLKVNYTEIKNVTRTTTLGHVILKVKVKSIKV